MTKANQGRDAFLISLKAGGGLNLTGADTVILVDLWWNPAVEAQAIGRNPPHGAGADGRGLSFDYQRGPLKKRSKNFKNKRNIWFPKFLDGTESRASLSLAEIREILGISEAMLKNQDNTL